MFVCVCVYDPYMHAYVICYMHMSVTAQVCVSVSEHCHVGASTYLCLDMPAVSLRGAVVFATDLNAEAHHPNSCSSIRQQSCNTHTHTHRGCVATRSNNCGLHATAQLRLQCATLEAAVVQATFRLQ